MSTAITAGAPRRRRQIRAVLTFAVAIAFLAGSFYYAYKYIKNGSSSTKAAPTSCATVAVGNAAAPADTTVNVYNATTRGGLAGEVAASLKQRGFVIGKVANDPLKRRITKAAEVRFGAKGKKQSLAVAHQLKGSVRKQDKRKDASVDFVIGDAFVDLDPAQTCTSTSTNTATS